MPLRKSRTVFNSQQASIANKILVLVKLLYAVFAAVLFLNVEVIAITTKPTAITIIVAGRVSLIPILTRYRVAKNAYALGKGVRRTAIGSYHGDSHLYQTESNRASHGRDPNPFSDCPLHVLSPPDFGT